MKTKTKAIVTLMAISPLFAELLTGNTPASAFINPLMLIILFVGYCLPILIIRELSVRWKLGILGIAILGFAYGIFNEGIGAKTLLAESGLPVSTYDNYGRFLGINFPFWFNISVFHILVSVLFPVLFVHYLYPSIKKETWFSKKLIGIFVIPVFLAGTFVFFSKYPVAVQPIYFPIFVAAIFVLVVLAKFMPKSEGLLAGRSKITPLFWGVSFIVVFNIFGSILASGRTNLILFYSFMSAVILFFTAVFKLKKWFTLPALIFFAIGVCMALGATGGINTAILKGRLLEGIFTAVIFEIIFAIAVLKILRKNNETSKLA